MKKLRFACSFLFGYLLVVAHANAADLCTNLTELAKNSSDISVLRAEKLGEDFWASKITFGEFDFCRLTTHNEKLLFKCGTKSIPLENKAIVFDRVEKIAKSLWSCPNFDTYSFMESKVFESINVYLSKDDFQIGLMAGKQFDWSTGGSQEVWKIELTFFEK